MFLNNRGVRIKRVEFRENVTGFFSQGQSKQSAIMMCPIKRVSVKWGLSVQLNISEQFLHGPLGQIAAREIRIMALSPPRDSR